MKLVDNWRDGWKWLSVHFSGASVLINAYGAIALKGAAAASSVLGILNMRGALIVGATVSLAGLVGRFICQSPTGTEDAQK